MYEVSEEWRELEDYPGYSVSNLGEVINASSNRTLRISHTKQGAPKVGLSVEGRQSTRSIKVLVARAFVDGETDVFNTPINLDGDQDNNIFTNLMWRPRWFALLYARQFALDYSYYHQRAVIDLVRKERYVDIWDAATTNGLLFKDVLTSCHGGGWVFPTRQDFEQVE